MTDINQAPSSPFQSTMISLEDLLSLEEKNMLMPESGVIMGGDNFNRWSKVNYPQDKKFLVEHSSSTIRFTKMSIFRHPTSTQFCIAGIGTDGKLYTVGTGTLYAGRDGNLATMTQFDTSTAWTDCASKFWGGAGIRGGQVIIWGASYAGQNGNNSTASTSVAPTVCPTRTASNHVGLSAFHSDSTNCGLFAWTSTGEVWAIGGTSSMLGIGLTSGNTSAATQCTALSNVISVKSGQQHSIALTSTGQIWTCGTNSNGKTGQGTSTGTTTTWTRVGADADWSKIWAGNIATFAQKTNGDIYACGSLTAAGLTTTVTTMTKILDGADGWDEVGADSTTTFIAKKSNGELYMRGTGQMTSYGMPIQDVVFQNNTSMNYVGMVPSHAKFEVAASNIMIYWS